MLKNYEIFINSLQKMIDRNFENQSPFIKCKMGCAKCCQNGNYPFSEIELKYLKQEFIKLSPEIQTKIKLKIKDLLDKKSNSTEKTFMHECPFLIDNVCSVYQNRGIICRTFGLIYYLPDGKMQIPFCAYDNLNYSDVFDIDKKMITQEKMDKSGIEVLPKSYNLHYDVVTDKGFEQDYKFSFGFKGSLLDVLERDSFF